MRMARHRTLRPESDREDPTRHNLLVRVARLYYLRNLTHQEIADREGMSRIKVTRLLQEALQKNIVEFRIKDPKIDTLELEESFQSAFGLRQAIIAPTLQTDAEVYDVLGRFAADFLNRHLRAHLSIGIGWGRTLNGMLPYLERSPYRDLRVVSLTGGLSANDRQPNPYDVASAFADRLKAGLHYPLLPAIVESEQTRKLLMKEKSIREMLALWTSIDIALISIGVIATDTGVYYSFADPTREAKRVMSLGAVGDILTSPFDEQGRLVDAGFSRRLIRIPFEDLKKIPIVAGIAGGRHKVKAILGALRSGYLNTLITDEETARQVLALATETGGKS
jgi:DNA-binding transcriptional regulator LsrR (DeoR family)